MSQAGETWKKTTASWIGIQLSVENQALPSTAQWIFVEIFFATKVLSIFCNHVTFLYSFEFEVTDILWKWLEESIGDAW